MLSISVQDTMLSRSLVRTRITSIDQLYTQAATMDAFFREKVMQIAAQCDGHFWVQDAGQEPLLLPLREIQLRPQGTKSILWAQLKHVDRAMAKAATIYNGDVSRIYDFVRQRIIFSSVKSIYECLHCIYEDPDMEVVAVRNLLDPQRKATANAGFRDVLVIVRLVTHATKWWGISGHLCELSLVHRDMQALLNPMQHERYLRYARRCLFVDLKSQRDRLLRCSFFLSAPLYYLFKLSPQTRRRSCWASILSATSQNAPPDTPTSSTHHSILPERREAAAAEGPGRDQGMAWRLGCEHLSANFSHTQQSTKELMAMRAAEFIRVRNSFSGGFLDQRLNEVRYGVKQADATMVLFTRPVGVMTKRPILFIVLVAGIYFAWDLFGESGRLQAAIQAESFQARHMRVTALEARSPEWTALTEIDFGPLKDGCEVWTGGPHLRLQVSRDVQHIYSTMINANSEEWHDDAANATGVFRANGFYIRTNDKDASQASDPVRFLVHRSMREVLDPKDIAEEDWILESAAGCFFGINDLKCTPREHFRYPLPEARGEMIRFDLRSPWFMYLGTVVVYLPIVIGCLLCPVLGFLGYTHGSLSAFSFNFWMPGVLEVVTAVGMLLDDRDFPQNNSFYWWLLGLSSMVFGCVIQFYDAFFMRYIPVHFLITIVGLNIHNSHIVQQPGFEVPISPSFTFVFWICFCLFRVVVLKRAGRRVQEDVERYGMEWRATCETPEKSEDLARLDLLVHQFENKARPQHSVGAVLELDHAANGPLLHATSFLPKIAISSQVVSLDQLYMQAALLEPLFLVKVKQIACASAGMRLQNTRIDANTREQSGPATPLAPEASTRVSSEGARYTYWRDEHNLDARQTDQLGLKSVDRAIEKLRRSYNCDVTVLLDLVRQCIVFESVSDMLLAIQSIQTEPEIVVKRVKNRLSLSYDASLSLGYRDVLFNICIDSSASRRLGLSGHVCELQLILRSFMDHKTLLGHKRYVEFRNMRCE